jgi:hypothetical protein
LALLMLWVSQLLLLLLLLLHPRIPKVHVWFTCSAGQGNLPTAAKWF